jgi:predicted alpha/beta-fold hydrolase
VVAGVSLFAVAATMGDRRPLRVFVLGTTLGVLAVAVSAVNSPGSIWQAGQWLGASLGGGLAWYLVRPGAALNLRQTVVVGAPIAVLWVAIYLSAPPLLVAVVGTAVLAGLIVSAPTFVDRVTDPA